jgi:flavodoxin
MKILVVYYSRTGSTKKIGLEIARLLKADIEQIEDVKSRLGLIGWLKSGREAQKKILAEIKSVKKDPKKYDLTVVGTPIWASNMSSPIRTYLTNNKFKKIAFFCACGGKPGNAFEEMSMLSGKPVATLAITSKEIAQNAYPAKVKEFVKKLK